MKRVFTLIAIFALFYSASLTSLAQTTPTKKYLDTSLSFEKRAEILVSEMTLDEKISQMVNDAKAIDRLGIPKYNWWSECLHGMARSGKATIFPQAVGLGATFDPALMKQITNCISDEARGFYNSAIKRNNRGIYTGLTFYSPNVNIFRDPRWGRGQETYGEDPFLTSRMGVAFVEGLQGDDPKYMKAAACAKHYAVHSGPEKFRHGFNALVSTRDLYETYLPAFKALVKEAKVESVMGAYNRTNGEPCCASPTLLKDILRNDWGFKGYVTSDCEALVDIYKHHKYASNEVESAALAIHSGLNLNCGSTYNRSLKKAVNQGLINEKDIDKLLIPLMTTRFKLGLFDPEEDCKYNKISADVVNEPSHRELAYKAAVESMVLMKNKDNTLPLKQDLKYIYVTGPLATSVDAMMGNYFGVNGDIKTYLEGLTSRTPNGVSIQYRQGVLLEQANINPMDWATGEAAKADVIVACVGLTWLLEGEEGESIASRQKGDMTDNSLPQCQIDYLKRLKERIVSDPDKKLIVVVSAGSPVNLKEINEIADAVIYAWYPGEEGGDALADIIYGNVSPSGKTPLTFVKSLDQLPDFKNYDMEGRTYKYMNKEPLFPFGYGLSYTTFKYEDLIMPKTIKAGENVTVKVDITNTGNMDSDEVVQLYITDDEASAPVPVRQLAAFKRVSLKKGETKTISLNVDKVKFSLINNKNKREIEPGSFTISLGGGQPVPSTDSYVQGTITVKGHKSLEL
ncbi:MAG: glycoside hydrolase family 3 N-terminal domain-containing protein [Bacteroidales bacterium]